MAFEKAKNFTPRMNDIYESRYPTLDDLTRQGGIPGYVYFLCSAAHIGEYQRQGADLVKDLPALTIIGPAGTASAFLMCAGTPIEGADPMNGVREYHIDPLLEDATGIPIGGTLDAQGETQGGKGDARVQGRQSPKQQRTEGDEPQAGGGDRAQRAAEVGTRVPAQSS